MTKIYIYFPRPLTFDRYGSKICRVLALFSEKKTGLKDLTKVLNFEDENCLFIHQVAAPLDAQFAQNQLARESGGHALRSKRFLQIPISLGRVPSRPWWHPRTVCNGRSTKALFSA